MRLTKDTQSAAQVWETIVVQESTESPNSLTMDQV